MPTRQSDLGNSLIQVPSSRVTGFVPRTAEANEDNYSTVSRVTGSGLSAGKRSIYRCEKVFSTHNTDKGETGYTARATHTGLSSELRIRHSV